MKQSQFKTEASKRDYQWEEENYFCLVIRNACPRVHVAMESDKIIDSTKNSGPC